MFTGWYWWGYPPPPLPMGIIGLRGKFFQVFEFKGVNLQSIHNKGVKSCSLGPLAFRINELQLTKLRKI